MFKLTFDEASHVYKLDGAIIPSVTQVLAGELYDPLVYAEVFAQFGTDVHAACELWDLYQEETANPSIRPYLVAWRSFCEQKGLKLTEVEEMHYHETLRYAGTPDRVGVIGSSPVLIDIKSGSKQWWHRFQTCGYLNMFEKPLLSERWCVYLKNDGTYSIDIHSRQEFGHDLSIFMAALTLYNARRRYGS